MFEFLHKSGFMTPRIHQIVAGYLPGNAVSNFARLTRKHIRAWGYQSEIYCDPKRTANSLRNDARDLHVLADDCRPNDVAILHITLSSPANLIFPALRCRKVIMFHNITPSRYFRHINPALVRNLDEGVRQCASLAHVAEVNLVSSQFNAECLLKMGFPHVSFLPFMVDLAEQHRDVNEDYRDRFNDGRVNILFVGRVVPNKRHDDLLRVFHHFQHAVEPQSRLIMAGSYGGTETYRSLLLSLAKELCLQQVVLTGGLTQPRLNACYRSASAFLCMSEHEGFCVPLLEAMYHNLPVLAVSSTAIPETLDGAGILFKERNYALIAETMGQLLRDGMLREAVQARQQVRLASYLQQNFGDELRQALAPVL